MTDPVFQVVNKKRQSCHKFIEKTQNVYNNLLQEYLSQSYGYYNELFIKKISEKAQTQHEKLRKFQLRKSLRESTRKYLMTDLQLVFLSHFANIHQWNYDHPAIALSIDKNEDNNELNQISKFKLFLHLLCFFVKSYISSPAQVSALIDFHSQNLPVFGQVYACWMQNNPQYAFRISPRQLNQIYTEHSKNCGQRMHKKDYNQMVDKILDISTTYATLPTKQKFLKEKRIPKGQKQPIPIVSRKSIPYLQSNMMQNSLRMDFSDLRSYKKQSIILAGSSFLNGKYERSQIKQDQKINFGANGQKRISLNKKRKVQKDEINNVAKSFFRGKDINSSMQDLKKSENSLRDIVPSNFLDLNIHSSRIQSLPLPYRNNSNIFGPSTLF